MINENKKALVTGGTRGIGRAIVEEFVNNNIDVVFIYRNSDKLADELVNKLNPKTSKIFSIKADVSSFAEAEKSVKQTIEYLGGIDILVNNAGIAKDNLLLRMTEEDFDTVITANLKSVFNFTKAVLKPMIKQRSGKIVNITSVVGLIGNAGQANYASSKAGIIGFTKSIAKEVASRKINVNAVAPGFIETDMTENLNENQKDILLKQIPLARLGKPEDVAKVVSFLCSENSSYITGQVLSVDGGMVM